MEECELLIRRRLRQFKIGDDWEVFGERLEQYFVYKILKNLTYPNNPSQSSYTALSKLLEGQFQTKRSKYRNRIKFDGLKQASESIKEWYVKVKRTAADCEFGDSFESRVLDKFVAGMSPGRILDRLCEEPLTKNLSEMLELALAKEAAFKENSTEIHKFQHFQNKGKKQTEIRKKH